MVPFRPIKEKCRYQASTHGVSSLCYTDDLSYSHLVSPHCVITMTYPIPGSPHCAITMTYPIPGVSSLCYNDDLSTSGVSSLCYNDDLPTSGVSSLCQNADLSYSHLVSPHCAIPMTYPIHTWCLLTVS